MQNAEFYSRTSHLARFHLPFRIMFFKQTHCALHYHDFEELVCVLKGEGQHECDGRCYHISTGDIFLIRSGSRHAYYDCRNLLIANILFLETALDGVLPVLSKIPGYRAFFKTEPLLRQNSDFKAKLNISGDGLEEIRLLLFKWEYEFRSRLPGYEIASEAYFRYIVTLIARNYQNSGKKSNRQMFRLSQMVDFIDKNFAAKISREDIVQSAFTSVTSASRLFQNYMQKSMIEYLMEVRIKHAKTLLASSDKKITEIAALCGFENGNYFSQQFHRLTGLSPRLYRQGCNC